MLLVFGFGGGFGGLPPGPVVRVPLDGLLEAGLEVRVLRTPAQLGLQLGRVDRVPSVVAGAVPDPVERVLRLAHHPQDHAQHGDVVPLPVRADQVRLADPPAGEDVPYGAGVVVGVDPVAHVQAPPVQFRPEAVEDVGDLAGDELLHMLVGPVVIAAVRDRRTDPERAVPGAHEQVGAGLRARVRAGGVVGGVLGELVRVVEGEVAVDLVGADVVVAHVVLAARLQKAERALHVRLEERLGVGDRVVVVRLGRVVHDRVMPRHEFVEQLRVADVAVDELHTVAQDRADVLQVARVRERVQDGDVHVGVVVVHVVHEVGSDEAAAAGHNDVMRSKRLLRFFGHTPIVYRGGRPPHTLKTITGR